MRPTRGQLRLAHAKRVEKLNDRLAATIRAALRRMLGRVVAGLGDHTVLAAGSTAAVALDEAGIVAALWTEAVDIDLMPEMRDAYRNGGVQALKDYLGVTGSTGITLPEMTAYAERKLGEARNRLVGLSDEIWGTIQAQLLEGLQKGESIDHLAERITGLSDMLESRAVTISRTEVISASNAGALDAVASLGENAPAVKIWLATNDGRTRESHAQADGQPVPIDEPFVVGGEELMFPGDPDGSPEEVINCRCTLIWQEEALTDEQQADMQNQQDESEMAAAATPHTGGMVALVPHPDDAQRMAVDGYEPPERLHITLAFLGDGGSISPEVQDAYSSIVQSVAGSTAPMTASAHGHAVFNAAGDEPCTVYLVSDPRGDGGETGDPAAKPLTAIHEQLWAALGDYGLEGIPAQHSPWVPHIAVGYGLDPAALDQAGSDVRLDTLRFALGDDIKDFPLVGTGAQEAAPPAAPAGFSQQHSTKAGDMRIETLAVDGPIATGAPNPPVTAMHPVEWEGTLALEGQETGDGREFAPGSLVWDVLPLPFSWQPISQPEHQESVLVGLITNIERRDGGVIFGQGCWDHGSEVGTEAMRLVSEGFLKGVSVDVDSVKDSDVEVIMPQDSPAAGADGEVPLFGPAPEKVLFHSGRIRGATLLPLPAFAEAEIHVVALDAPPITGAPDAYDNPVIEAKAQDALTAAAAVVEIPDLPPAWWFDEPTDVELDGALTITDEGRVYGLLAPANTRHIAPQFRGRKVPTGVDYSKFHRGVTVAMSASGAAERIVTGNLTMACGHAGMGASGDGAAEHYDNTCSLAARVRVGDGPKGPWVAGALMPGVGTGEIVRMMACQASGDWRPTDEGPLGLFGALLVPVPGFPMARKYASVRYREGQLVASAVPVQLKSQRPAKPVPMEGGGVIADLIASSVGLDRRSRAAALAAEVKGV